MLYALAPLPYATGLLPLLFADEIDIEFLPPVKEAMDMSFKERNIQGFKLGMKKGIEYFFGLGSVLYYVSQGLTSMQERERKGLLGKLRSVSSHYHGTVSGGQTQMPGRTPAAAAQGSVPTEVLYVRGDG